ncbi:MAG: thiamine phosphate synthase [Thermoanaerobaculia bacterium]
MRRDRRPPPRSLAISAGEGDPPDAIGAWVERVAAAGVEAVEIREKAVPDGRLLELVCTAVQASAGRLRVLVNGRFDVAMAAGADGVHLPADGLPTAAVRREMGQAATVGRSTHAQAEIVGAAEDGADYVTFGPVFATPAKTRFGPPQGLQALRAACSQELPVLAIGGVTEERFTELASAGAWGVAAIRLFQAPGEELEDTVRLIGERFAS